MEKICSIEGCGKKEAARGWCSTHYMRWRSHGDPLHITIRTKDAPATCVIDDCIKPVFVKEKGWCQRHYTQWYRWGDPLLERHKQVLPPLESLFWPRVEANNGFFGCWLWTGQCHPKGYGTFSAGRAREKANPGTGLRTAYVHVIAYEWLVGPVPQGLQLDHQCENKNCLNPFHLKPATGRDNSLRSNSPAAMNARKTHCINNHPYDEENTGWYGTHRFCKVCRREQKAVYRKGNSAPKRGRKSLIAYNQYLSLEGKLGLLIDKNTLGGPLKTPCWLWLGNLDDQGYGKVNGKKAHIVNYESCIGPVPDNLVLDHLCRVHDCVRPDHLEPVTSGKNALRGVGVTAQLMNRTHFSCDHEITPENTIMERSGFRRCRTCVNARARRDYHKNKP